MIPIATGAVVAEFKVTELERALEILGIHSGDILVEFQQSDGDIMYCWFKDVGSPDVRAFIRFLDESWTRYRPMRAGNIAKRVDSDTVTVSLGGRGEFVWNVKILKEYIIDGLLAWRSRTKIETPEQAVEFGCQNVYHPHPDELYNEPPEGFDFWTEIKRRLEALTLMADVWSAPPAEDDYDYEEGYDD